MININEIFPKPCNLLAVIDCQDMGQTIANFEIAKDSGADGVFLISPNLAFNEFLKMFEKIRASDSKFWLGVNFLVKNKNSAERDLELARMLNLKGLAVNGLWVNDCGYNDNLDNPLENVYEIPEWKKRYGVEDVLLFGGLGFVNNKFPPTDLISATAQCKNYVDVITTSGSKADMLPVPRKISMMKKALSNTPLANAGGITPENVLFIKQYLKFCIVETALNRPGTKDFDPNRVKQMADAIAAVQAAN